MIKTIKFQKSILFIVMAILQNLLIAQNQISSSYIYELMEDQTLSLSEVQESAEKYFKIVGQGQGTGYKHYMRWYNERKFHIDDKGFLIPFDVEQRNWISATQSMKQNTKRAPWFEMGPSDCSVTSSWNPGVGRVRWVTPNPADINTLYAASDGGGIWKSVNGGTDWFSTTETKTSDYFSTNYIVVDANDTNIVYCVLLNNRIVKSTDAGATWNYPYSGSPSTTKRMLLIPNNSQIVLATSSGGIYRSTNGGTSWTLVLSASGLEDIKMQPGSNDIIYASGSGTQTFWKSTNGGLNWTNITNGITNTGRTLIGVSSEDASVVYLVQASGSLFGRLYKSTDGGDSFITTVIGNPTNGTNYFGYEPDGTGLTGQAGHDMAIAVHPNNTDIVHIAGIICFKSTNGGTSFTATTDWVYPNSYGYNHADVHCLNYVDTTIFSSSDGGVCKSVNDGGDWTSLWNGCAVKQLYRICCAKTENYTIGCGAQDNGQAYKYNSGPWNQWMGADGMDVAISTTNNAVAIGTYQNGGIYRTINGGTSYTGLSAPGSGNWITPIVWHPNNADTVYGGWNGIYRSANKGTNWTKISGTTLTANADCLAVGPTNTQYIYASAGANFYYTTNGGASWSTVAIGATVSSICVHPNIPYKVYITTTASTNNVRVSTDNGATWTNINTGLPGIAARSIAVDDDSNEGLYVGMNIGVYFKDNVNTNWSVYGTDLPNVAIQDVEIQQSASKVRIATYGRGVWENDTYVGPSICNVPQGHFTDMITTNSVKVNWTAVLGAVSYTVEYKENTSSIWINLGDSVNNSRNLTGLNPGTLYDWRVRTNCSFGSSTYSSSQFTTLSVCGSPGPLTASITGVNNLNFSWATVVGANNYTFEYKLSTSSIWTSLTLTSTSYSIANASSGRYNSRVKANCNAGSSSFVIGNDVIAYCASSGTNTTSWIKRVNLKTIDRNSVGDPGGYNFSSTPTPNVVPGVATSMIVSPGFSGGSSKQNWAIYIDINANGIYESTEALNKFTTNNSNNKTISLTIPNGATLGVTRMRVIMRGAGAVSTACGSQGNGEVEDYLINISTTASHESIVSLESKETDIIAYPNPAKNVVNVELVNISSDQNTDIEILKLNGELVIKKQIQLFENARNLHKIEIDELLNGPYLIRVKLNDRDLYTKMIKLQD